MPKKNKSLMEKVNERLEKLLYVPREKDGKLVKWNNSPTLDEARKIFSEEVDGLVAELQKRRESIVILDEVCKKNLKELADDEHFLEKAQSYLNLIRALNSQIMELDWVWGCLELKQNE